MSDKGYFQKEKFATVAISSFDESLAKSGPIDQVLLANTIVGTGFNVHPSGVLVTAFHVLKPFMTEEGSDKLDWLYSSNTTLAVQIENPFKAPVSAVLLLEDSGDPSSSGLLATAPVSLVHASPEWDLAILRLPDPRRLESRRWKLYGYPYLELERPESVTEGMEVGICGFPLGSDLQRGFRIVTSVLTKGIVSGISPFPGAGQVQSYLLNANTYEGSSGGPVISLETGRVFAVVDSGVTVNNETLPWLCVAQPLHRYVTDERIRNALRTPG
jgi:hypothetical protein